MEKFFSFSFEFNYKSLEKSLKKLSYIYYSFLSENFKPFLDFNFDYDYVIMYDL